MSIYNATSPDQIYDPNGFLKGAQAAQAFDQIRAQNTANMQAQGGDNASAVQTLNNQGLYGQASQQASTPYTQQYADNAATSNNVALQGQQLNLQNQQQNQTDQAQAAEAQHVLQATTMLKQLRDANPQADLGAAFDQMTPFLTSQLGLKPEDAASIKQQLASNPNFLDTVHGAAQSAVSKLNLKTGADGNEYNFKMDANGNPVGQQVQMLGPDGNPLAAPAAGAQPGATPSGAPTPAVSGLTHAAMVALAEDSQHPDAVLSVMMNRARQTGGNLDTVLQAPGQFESVMNGAATKISPQQVQALMARPDIQQILQGNIPQQYQGLTNFYNPTLNAQLAQQDGRPAKPAWDNGSGVQIGQQLYFKGGPTGLPSPGTAGAPTPAGGVTQPASPASGLGSPTQSAQAPGLFGKPPKAGAGGAPTDPATLDFYAQQVNSGIPINTFVRGRSAEGQAELDAITKAGQARYGPNWNLASAGSNYKANSTALNQLNGKYQALTAFEGTISNNVQVLNSILTQGHGGTPNFGPATASYVDFLKASHSPQYNALVASAQAVGSEYGKYQGGGQGVAAPTDATLKAGRDLTNPTQLTGAEMTSALQVMQKDMAGQHASYSTRVNAVQHAISNGQPPVTDSEAAAAQNAQQVAVGGSASGQKTKAQLYAQYGLK